MFYDSTPELNELVDVISSYVTCSVDVLIPTKQIMIFEDTLKWDLGTEDL